MTHSVFRSCLPRRSLRASGAVVSALVLCGPLSTVSVHALTQNSSTGSSGATASTGTPINDRCPISGESIDGKTTTEHDGKVIGFCCPGCDDMFAAWSEERRVNFITTALQGSQKSASDESVAKADDKAADSADEKSAAAADAAVQPGPTYPYPLTTCPVTGEELGSMGTPVVKVYNNREVRFCCPPCIETFEADQANYWKQIDEKIVDQQRMHYPLVTCIVTEEQFWPDGTPVNHVHNNRLVRLASPEALETFKTDPEKYLKALDEKIAELQRADYPLDTCVVAGSELGSMGDPDEITYMNRLVRFCCASCREAFNADPNKFMKKIDAAYIEKQKDTYPFDTCIIHDIPLDSRGGPFDVVVGNQIVRFCTDSCVEHFKKHSEGILRKIRWNTKREDN